jgi:hypothetical protein
MRQLRAYGPACLRIDRAHCGPDLAALVLGMISGSSSNPPFPLRWYFDIISAQPDVQDEVLAILRDGDVSSPPWDYLSN